MFSIWRIYRLVDKKAKVKKSKTGYRPVLLFLIYLVFSFSCSSDTDESKGYFYKERTVLFYIVADNNLASEAKVLFEELSKYKN